MPIKKRVSRSKKRVTRTKSFAPMHHARYLQSTRYLYSVESAVRLSKGGAIGIFNNYYGSETPLTKKQVLDIAQNNWLTDYGVKSKEDIIEQKVIGIYHGYGKRGY